MVDYIGIEAVTLEVSGGSQNGKKFLFDGLEVAMLDEGTTNNKVAITFPQESKTEESSIEICLGVLADVTFNFKLFHQTNDRSDGTNTTQIKTNEEMLNYLDTILFPGVDLVRFKITIVTKFRTKTAYYSLENYSFKTDGGVFPAGSMKFKWVKDVA
jgi:hypothetical protein